MMSRIRACVGRVVLSLAVLALVVGCRGQRVVVIDEPVLPFEPVIESCEDAFAFGETGVDCAGLEMGCFEELGCCVESAFCEFGHLIVVEDCGGCGDCVEDVECGSNTWCLEGTCVPCPPVGECPACPGELEPLIRNGCETCECVPASQCVSDADCGDPGIMRCETGAFCACDDHTCCSNACVSFECAAPEPPPEGCVRPCGEGDPCETGACRQINCRCDGDHWECESVCTMDPTPEC